MNSARISVIVAVFNVATVMRRGIDSLLAQSFRDIEVLLVDDDSTDGSAAICDEYAEADKRVRVFHKVHSGVAHTRQVGVDNARGEYSIHFDPDDWAEPTMLEEMFANIERTGADMLVCDYYEDTVNDRTLKKQKLELMDSDSMVNDMISGKLIGSLWNKLIRTSCYKKWNIRFPRNLNVREDIVVVCNILQHTERVCYLPKAFYHYDRTSNTNSLTATYIQETPQYYAQEVLWHKAFLRNTKLNPCNKSQLEYGLMNLAYTTLRSDLFKKAQWHDTFDECCGIFMHVVNDYKRKVVLLAMNGHYCMASTIRTLLSIKKKLKLK